VGAFDEDSFRRAQTFAPQTTIAMRAVNQLHIERAQQTRDRAVAATFAAPAVAGTLALCITDGRCRAGSPARNLLTLQADAALYNLSHPNFGYQGDPLHPSLRRYHGFLVRAGSY